MNTTKSSAKLKPQVTFPSPSPLDATASVKTLVSTEAATPVVSLQPSAAQQSVAAAYPVGNILVEPADVIYAPPARHRPFRPHLPHLRPIHIHTKVHTFDSFQYRNYRFLWASTLFSSGGFWLQQVIIGWLTYQLTQSALLTSIAMGLDALPILLAGPLGGILVDSADRRKLLSAIFAYQAVVALTFGLIVLLGVVETWHIFAFILLMGMSWVITDPARMSLIPNMVPRQNLVNAFALNAMAFSITRLAAPAAGGLILALAGAGPALLLEGVVIFIAVLMALKLQLDAPAKTRLRLRSALSEILQGVRYIRSEPVILGLLLFSILPAVLIMPFLHGLIPVYAAEVFLVGPATLGVLMSSIGAGSMLGTLILASFVDIKRKGMISIAFIGMTALAMAIFSHSPTVALAIPTLMLGSMGVIGYFSTTNALMQSIMPDGLRGRVTGIYIMTFGTMPLGSLAAGAIAEGIGAPLATLIASGILLAVATGFTLKFKAIWQYQ